MTLGLQGERFGQKPPSLIKYLHDLIRDYPKGIGIVKEFVQNADDAGATYMKVLVDWRTHPSAALTSSTMAALLGPALLFYNEACFTDRDLEGIERLSSGSKGADTGKTGRFGLGFNSAYNVTDVPTFITKDYIYFFDPHGTTVELGKSDDPGQRFTLKTVWDKAPDLLVPFLPLGLEPMQTFYPGTAFRLPFRTEAQARVSEISQEPFGHSDIEAILESLERIGAELLLFLRHLTTIEVYEINEAAPKPWLRCGFRTGNEGVVKDRRERLSQWQGQGDVLPLIKRNRKLSVTYRHAIEVTVGETKREEVWRIVNGLYCDPDGVLAEEAKELNESGEKVFPNAGAAALISGREGKRLTGNAYCFLPLPVETKLPVHIHGFFDLDRSRRNLTDGNGQSGNDARRGRWNALLVKHAVAAAYSELLVKLRADVGEANPEGYYQCWPLNDASGLFAQLLPSLVEHLEEELVVSTAASGRWRTFEDSVTLEADWTCLKEPLAAMELPVADPALPPELESALRDVGATLEELSPQRLAQALRLDYDLNCPLSEVEQPWLRKREWLKDLLKFCLRAPYADLSGLPLALMADGKLRTFGRVRHSDGSVVNIYLGGGTERWLFLPYASLFVEAAFAQEAGLKAASQAQVQMMTPALVVQSLNWILDEQDLTQPRSWQPNGEGLPNDTWLTKVYEYPTLFEAEWWDRKEVTRETFKCLALVPDQFSALRRPGFTTTPLLLDDKATPLKEALDYLDVPVVSAEAPLKQAIGRFADEIGEFVYRATPVDLVDTLGSLDFLGDTFEAEIHGPILDFLAESRAIQELKQHRKEEALAGLKMFPVVGDRLVSLRDEGVFLSVARNLPPDLKRAHFLEEGQDSRWLGLLRFLGAEELTEARIAELILDDYGKLDNEEKLRSLTWLRDNLSAAEQSAGGEAEVLRERIRRSSLVRCDDGLYRAITETYAPNVELPRKVLGDNAPLPDMNVYDGAQDRWLEFFVRFGMASSPRPEDLIIYLNSLLDRADQDGVQAVEEALAQFGKHISRNWSELEQMSATFAAYLRERAWLPSLQRPNRDIPGFIAPEDRLYRPEEIYATSSASLIASQAPVLLFSLSSEMRTSLEIPARPDTETVLQHFNHLLELWHFTDHSGLVAKPFGESIEAIYRFLGGSDSEPGLAAYDDRPCLWDSKTQKLWLPRHTFGFGANIDVFGSRRVQLLSENRAQDNGYKVLGRRDEVEPSDHLGFLLELLDEYRGKVLSAKDQKGVLKVLDYLKLEADPEELGDVPVLTQVHTLVSAEEAYLNDADWFASRLDVGAVNLLHPKIDGEFALALGVASLSKSVQEKLNGLVRSEQTDTQQQCQKWQETVRSPEFSQGVRRLVENAGAEVRDGDLRLFTRIVVVPAKVIRTTLWLESEWRKIGEGRTDSIFVDDRDEVCLSEPPLAKFLADELNKTLEDARLNDTSTLIEMLNASPDDIAELLDRFRVSPLKGDIAERQKISDAPWEGDGEDEGDWQGSDLLEGDSSKTALRAEQVSEAVRERPQPTRQHGSTTQVPEQDTRANARPAVDNPTGNEPFDGGAVRLAGPKGAPRQLKSSERSASRSKSAWPAKQRRHRTFVYAEREIVEDNDEDEGRSERAQRIGHAAELSVMAYEAREGRIPTHYGGNNEGYDIMSTSADGSRRYIEVKGIDGLWGERGVAMSSPQYRNALDEGSNYWLYVVEYALNDEAALITPIENPTGTVTRYVFDAGWKDIV